MIAVQIKNSEELILHTESEPVREQAARTRGSFEHACKANSLIS